MLVGSTRRTASAHAWSDRQRRRRGARIQRGAGGELVRRWQRVIVRADSLLGRQHTADGIGQRLGWQAKEEEEGDEDTQGSRGV